MLTDEYLYHIHNWDPEAKIGPAKKILFELISKLDNDYYLKYEYIGEYTQEAMLNELLGIIKSNLSAAEGE